MASAEARERAEERLQRSRELREQLRRERRSRAARSLKRNREKIEATVRGTPGRKPSGYRVGKSPSSSKPVAPQ